MLDNNDQYRLIQFGNKVIFKGNSRNYLKAIDLAMDQTALKKQVKVEFISKD